MLAVKIGTISEVSKMSGNGTLIYKVSLFSRKKRKRFSTFEEANTFVQRNAHNMIKTNEVHAVSIEFKRKNGRKTYFQFENVYDENDKLSIVEYESSEFDYILINSPLFPKDATRKIVNDSYYSFHDVIRSKILKHNNAIFIRYFVYLLTVALSLAFLFLGLHLFHFTYLANSINTKLKIFFDVVHIASSISMIITSSALISLYMQPIRKLRKINWVYHKANWRKINKIREALKKVIVFFWSVVFSLSFSFVYEFYQYIFATSDPEMTGYKIVFVLFYVLFLIISIEISISVYRNYIWKKRKIPSLYTCEEIVSFKDWINFKSTKVLYKTNKGLFVFPFEHNNELVSFKIKTTEESNEKLTNQEIKFLRQKTKSHYKKALRVYKNSVKWEN